MIIHRDPFATPLTVPLVYGSADTEGLRLRVRAAGLSDVSRRSGVPFETLRDWCRRGGRTSTALLIAVSTALAECDAEPVRRCARDGCERPARSRSPVCSEACKKARARGGTRPAAIADAKPAAPPRACARDGCERPARSRSPVCSEACKKACARKAARLRRRAERQEQAR